MKVSELLEELSKADPDQEVFFCMDEGCCGDTMELDAYDAECVEMYDGEKYVRVFFRPVPGYSSCRQSGNTKRAHEEYWAQFKKKDDK